MRTSYCQGLRKPLPRRARTPEFRGNRRRRDLGHRPSANPRPRFVSSGAWRERPVRLALRGSWCGGALGRTPRRPRRPGPTLISTASLEEVARWFGFDLAEARRRFRANLEIGGCEAFWKDTLASPARPALNPSLADLPPISRLIPTPICRRPSLGNSRSARPGFGRQAPASGAWCRAAIASPGPSRPTSATRSRGGCGRTHLYRLGVNTVTDRSIGEIQPGLAVR